MISEEGEYTIVLTDLAGNSTTYTFTIDKTAPILSGIDNNAKLNYNVKLSWTEYGCVAVLKFASFDEPDNFNESTYSKNNYLTQDGIYIITVTDLAGNSSTIEFQIKKSLPIIEIVGENNNTFVSEVKNNNKYSINSIFNLVAGEDCTITINDSIYNSNTIIDYGTYNVKVTDAYGNTVSFVISFNAPATAAGSTNFGSTISDILLCIFGGFVVIAIIVRITLSLVKRKRKLHRK